MIRLEMNKKQEAILAAIIILAALGVFVLYTGLGIPKAAPIAETDEDDAPAAPALASVVAETAERQNAIFEQLHEQMESGKYRFDSPLVVVDPYGVSPLTAMVIFQTEEVMKISIKVTGKTDDVSVYWSTNGFETSHMIPVFGLYPDMVNMVEIIAEPAGQSKTPVQSKLLLIETGAMPEDFTENNILKYTESGNSYIEAVPPIYIFPEVGDSEGTVVRNEDVTGNNYRITGAEPPFFFTYVPLSAFDINGDYRWYYNGFDTSGTTAYIFDNMLIYIDPETGEAPLLLEINMLGRIISYAPYAETNFDADYYDAHHTFRRNLYT